MDDIRVVDDPVFVVEDCSRSDCVELVPQFQPSRLTSCDSDRYGALRESYRMRDGAIQVKFDYEVGSVVRVETVYDDTYELLRDAVGSFNRSWKPLFEQLRFELEEALEKLMELYSEINVEIEMNDSIEVGSVEFSETPPGARGCEFETVVDTYPEFETVVETRSELRDDKADHLSERDYSWSVGFDREEFDETDDDTPPSEL